MPAAKAGGRHAAHPGVITSYSIHYTKLYEVVFEGDRARPIMGAGAGVLSSVAKADGYVLVPENLEGYEEGQEVDVFLISYNFV